jgi:type VI secretion system VasD/TssJ family lipoprotein
VLILCLFIPSIFGCAGTLPEPLLSIFGGSRFISVFIQADNELNNGGNPVVVRIYQLSTDVNLRSETPESFWRDDQVSFQKDVVGTLKEIILHPREVLKIDKLEIYDETVFLIAAADFYKPDKDQWYYVYDISKNESDQVLIAVRDNTIAMTEVDY